MNFPARFFYISIPEVRHTIDLLVQLYIKYAPYISKMYFTTAVYIEIHRDKMYLLMQL